MGSQERSIHITRRASRAVLEVGTKRKREREKRTEMEEEEDKII
jgi:hypothetical protein